MLERGALDYRTSQLSELRDLIEEVKLPYPSGSNAEFVKGNPEQPQGPVLETIVRGGVAQATWLHPAVFASLG
jgi:hypothetical protein